MTVTTLRNATTSDLGFRVTGPTLSSLFAQAAKQLSKTQTNISKLKNCSTKTMRLKNETIGGLFYQFLSELIFLKDAKLFLGKSFKVKLEKKRLWHLRAKATGEVIKPDPRSAIVDIKAVTYHHLKITKTNTRWEATFIIDV